MVWLSPSRPSGYAEMCPGFPPALITVVSWYNSDEAMLRNKGRELLIDKNTTFVGNSDVLDFSAL